jgi:hypothetical protein
MNRDSRWDPGPGTGSPDLPSSGPHVSTEIQKIYQGPVRIWILTQFGEDFMKKSWNEVELNQRPGCPPAA